MLRRRALGTARRGARGLIEPRRRVGHVPLTGNPPHSRPDPAGKTDPAPPPNQAEKGELLGSAALKGKNAPQVVPQEKLSMIMSWTCAGTSFKGTNHHTCLLQVDVLSKLPPAKSNNSPSGAASKGLRNFFKTVISLPGPLAQGQVLGLLLRELVVFMLRVRLVITKRAGPGTTRAALSEPRALQTPAHSSNIRRVPLSNALPVPIRRGVRHHDLLAPLQAPVPGQQRQQALEGAKLLRGGRPKDSGRVVELLGEAVHSVEAGKALAQQESCERAVPHHGLHNAACHLAPLEEPLQALLQPPVPLLRHLDEAARVDGHAKHLYLILLLLHLVRRKTCLLQRVNALSESLVHGGADSADDPKVAHVHVVGRHRIPALQDGRRSAVSEGHRLRQQPLLVDLPRVGLLGQEQRP